MKNKIEEFLKLLYAIKDHEKEANDLSGRDRNLNGWHQRYMREKQEENQDQRIKMKKKYDALLKEFYESHYSEFENEIQPGIEAVRKLLESIFPKKECDRYKYDYLSNQNSENSIFSILNKQILKISIKFSNELTALTAF